MITQQPSTNPNEVVIRISGRFTFNAHAEFGEAYKGRPPTTRFVVDMADTTYVDSSALGMLLLLRDHVGGARDKVEIRNASPAVRKILDIAAFDRLFLVA